MSRAHMLFDNKALDTLPVKITYWGQTWQADVVFKRKSGNGLIIEGNIVGKARHTIADGVNKSTKFRYVAIFVDVSKATFRKFDQVGKEIEPDFGTTKKMNTGYLSSSYKNVSREGEDIIAPSKIKEMLNVNELDVLNQETISSRNAINLTTVWCDEKELGGVEIPDQSVVRLRTKGNGPYLESIVCLDIKRASKVNYTSGESVGGSWTDKVLNVKDEKQSGSHLSHDSQAVDDDEWDD